MESKAVLKRKCNCQNKSQSTDFVWFIKTCFRLIQNKKIARSQCQVYRFECKNQDEWFEEENVIKPNGFNMFGLHKSFNKALQGFNQFIDRD